MSKAELLTTARALMENVDEQIRQVEWDARKMNVPPSKLKNPRGEYILIPLLVAKAQLLTILNTEVEE